MNASKSDYDVCILGGGVIGACCALELATTGKRVAIVDKAAFGAACSHGNCGYVCPSHALPLCQPGVVRKNALHSLFPSSALYIKPRLDPAMIGWMWRFMRRCNRRDMLAAADGLSALLNSSRELYEQIIEREKIDCDFEAGGLQFVYETKAAHDAFAHTATMLGERYGLEARRIERDELVEAEPALRPDSVSGAWEFPVDAHLRPDLFMKGIRDALERKGVTILESRETIGIDRSGRSMRSLQTNAGDITADQFVIATGALTPTLTKLLELGIKIPIQPGKGYSYTTDRPQHCPKLPIIFEEAHVAVTPWKSGYRVGSTMEFAGYDTRMNERRLDNLRRASQTYLKDSPELPVLEKWYGWRPMTPDSLPMIGPLPGYDNVTLAAGHNMLGLSLATGTGRLVREMIDGERPHVDPSSYNPARFS